MAWTGAEGETRRQIARVLCLPPDFSSQEFRDLLLSLQVAPDVELSVAQRLWGSEGLAYRADFLTRLKENFLAELGKSNFAKASEEARAQINLWISGQTDGKIRELLKPGTVDSKTEMILVNAIYFKGEWKEKFESSRTIVDDFYLTGAGKLSTSFMNKTETFGYSEGEGFQFVQIPYRGGELAFFAAIPVGEQRLEKFNFAIFESLSGGLARVPVQLQLPKFKSSKSLELREVLGSLGMGIAFDRGKADFQGMLETSAREKFHLSNVIHEAVIEVNEEGTEAAAATAVAVVRVLSMRPRKVFEMKLNRPFVYGVRHLRTGAILFLGRFSKPS